MSQLILIGFMGSGKTTLGSRIAQQHQLPFYDLDQLIEARSETSIPAIFTTYGEPYFRQLETKALEYAISKPGILATGGGTILAAENQTILTNTQTPIVFLKTSLETVIERLKNDTSRPLAQDLTNLRRLYQTRESLYRTFADRIIDTDGQTPSQLSQKILTLL